MNIHEDQCLVVYVVSILVTFVRKIPSLNKTNGPEAHWSEGFSFIYSYFSYFQVTLLTLAFGFTERSEHVRVSGQGPGLLFGHFIGP